MLLPKNTSQDPEYEAEQLQLFTAHVKSKKHQLPLPDYSDLLREEQ